MFEPQKFFIGLIDFFSVLLPGAILAYLLKVQAASAPLVDRLAEISGPQGVAAFLVVSYLLGHFIFLLGAWLDEAYDFARTWTLKKQIRQLAWRGTLLPKWRRALLWMVFKREQDAAVTLATAIKATYLGPLQAGSTVNTFQWAKIFLAAEHQESLAVVQRFEADSKFFRSLAIVLALVLLAVVLAGLSMLSGRLALERWTPLRQLGVISMLLLPLALWRYAEQRLKATNQAYWSVITLEGRKKSMCLVRHRLDPEGPTHAGGVVYSTKTGSTTYLLVEAKRNPHEWVLPKGHIEAGEHPRETAVREVREETGVWARITGDLRIVSYSVKGEAVRSLFYLMEACDDGWWRGRPTDRGRRHEWLSLAAAVRKASHDSTRELLQAADARRVGKAGAE